MQQYHQPQTKRVRSGTGGARNKFSDKRLVHVGGVFAATRVATQEKRKKVRMRGGRKRVTLQKALYVNLSKQGKIVRTRLLRVLESHDPEYVRQNILTKGAIVETELGKARITNRIGQDGIVNALCLEP